MSKSISQESLRAISNQRVPCWPCYGSGVFCAACRCCDGYGNHAVEARCWPSDETPVVYEANAADLATEKSCHATYSVALGRVGGTGGSLFNPRRPKLPQTPDPTEAPR